MRPHKRKLGGMSSSDIMVVRMLLHWWQSRGKTRCDWQCDAHRTAHAEACPYVHTKQTHHAEALSMRTVVSSRCPKRSDDYLAHCCVIVLQRHLEETSETDWPCFRIGSIMNQMPRREQRELCRFTNGLDTVGRG